MVKAAEILRSEFDAFLIMMKRMNYDREMGILNSNAKQGLETLTNSYFNIIHFKCVGHTL